MEFWNKICGFILFFLITCFHVSAQNNASSALNYNTFILKNKLNSSDSLANQFPSVNNIQTLKSPVSANFLTSNYSFFCREELKLEKNTRIPFRFRLGSLEQCNFYEGKK